jgi:hypothetical protein
MQIVLKDLDSSFFRLSQESEIPMSAALDVALLN